MTRGEMRPFVDAWVRPNIVPIVGFCLLVVAQWVQLGNLKEQTVENTQKIDAHVLDRAIHIDPVRDARDRDEIMRRLQNIELKIDTLRTRE